MTESLFAPPQFPDDLTDKEKEEASFWANMALDSIALPTLGTLVARELFGDSVDDTNETLFKGAFIDETEPLQAELMARVSALVEEQGLTEPDCGVIQIFRRKAGLKTKKDEDHPGSYCAAVCMKDFQVIVAEKKEHILSAGMCSPLFKITDDDRPSVPFNRTQIKLGRGQGTLKTRNYLSVLVWVYWKEYPEKSEQMNVDTPDLRKVIDHLKSEEGETEPEEKEESSKEFVL